MDRADSGGSGPANAGRHRLESMVAHAVVAMCSIVLLCKEFAIPLDESSRGVILEMLRVGSLSSNYPLFGGMLELITQYIGPDRLALELLAHGLFLTSSFVWIVMLLKLLQGRNRGRMLTAMFVAIMLVNPVMIRFDLLAWRQSLSLSLFIFGVIVARGNLSKIALISISVFIHQGILPVVILFLIFTAAPSKMLWLSIPACVVGMAVLHATFPFQFLPEWIPFRLQLSDTAMLSTADPSFNNASGSLVLKYIATIALPAISLALAIYQKESGWVRLTLSLSLPLIVLNFIPGANRLIYYSIFAAVVCIPIMFAESVNKKIGSSVYWGFIPAIIMNTAILCLVQS